MSRTNRSPEKVNRRPTPPPAGHPKKSWVLSTPRLESVGNRQRVVANLAGHDVWFEIEGAELDPAPEPFVGLFLLQALQQGAQIESEAPLDPRWRKGISKILETYHEWWGFETSDPVVGETRDASTPLRPDRAAATCFSLGVDAFHSLYTAEPRPEVLVTMLGSRENDPTRAHTKKRLKEGVRNVAEKTGRRAVFTQSNLIDHPLHEPPIFLYTHGAALAAIGLLLAPEIRSLNIPSSYTSDNPHPWGSSWLTDPYFSTQSVEILHDASAPTRDQKLAAILDDPMARKHLRVCNKDPQERINCGRCQKCVRTRVALRCAGERNENEWATFAGLPPLEACLNAIPSLNTHVRILWNEMDPSAMPASERRALDNLFARSNIARRQRKIRSLWKSARSSIGL